MLRNKCKISDHLRIRERTVLVKEAQKAVEVTRSKLDVYIIPFKRDLHFIKARTNYNFDFFPGFCLSILSSSR